MKSNSIEKVGFYSRLNSVEDKIRNLSLVLCLMFYCVTIHAQGVVRDTLWKERFRNGIDASVFPDLESKYQATPLPNEGISLEIPKAVYATYDSKYFYSSGDYFRTPIKVIKNYAGNILYDSIRLEMAGVYYIKNDDLGWEKDFTFTYESLDNQSNKTIAEFTGKLSRMSNARGYDITKVCENCSSVNINVESFAFANFYKYVLFDEIISTYKNESGVEIKPSKKAYRIFFPESNDYALPTQTDLDFREPFTSNSLREYFCQVCANDISETNTDFNTYINCVNSTQLLSSFDYFIKFKFPGFNLIGYRNSSPNSIIEDEIMSRPKEVVQALNILGQTINNLDNYSGFAILVFSDGTKKKVLMKID